MKQVWLREFKDLTKDERESVRNKCTNNEVEFSLDMLANDLERNDINEDEYWKEIGCSKYYGESTSWFVPSVYYEHHKREVDQRVNTLLKGALFDSSARIVSVTINQKKGG